MAGRRFMPNMLVNIDVDDLEKGVAFYRDALGLTVGRRLGGSVVEMLGAGSAVYLLEKPADGVRDYRRHWTPVHLDFIVPDIEQAVAAAERAGAVSEGAIRTEVWGRIVTMADPFGHGFCLIQFLGRGYDQIAR
jgi:predicted enzyme related to lactoylglutathione lyase